MPLFYMSFIWGALVSAWVSRSLPLEELNLAFMFQRRGTGLERAEVAPLACARILLLRVQPVHAGLEFANHHLLQLL